MNDSKTNNLHFGIAEHGKICALQGDHVNALMHYREAINLSVKNQAPEVVFRHYLECSLESLEHMGAYSELIDYCNRAIDHYRCHPPQNLLAYFDLASIHQRHGVVLLKQGKCAQATRELEIACEVAKSGDVRLTLAETLLRWLKARLAISADRIHAEQVRFGYFSVRKKTVNSMRAVSISTPTAKGSSLSVLLRGE